MESKFGKKDGIEFREIVLSHLKRILELSSHELRDASRTVFKPNMEQFVEQEDTRLSYVQAVENLGYVLIPYFDSKIGEKYKKYMRVIGALDFQVKIRLKKTYDKITEEVGTPPNPKFFAVEMKLRYSKRLFKELNLLLKRNDYLQQSIFGEDGNDTIVEEKS